MAKNSFLTYLLLDFLVISSWFTLLMFIPKGKFIRWDDLKEKYPYAKSNNLGLAGGIITLLLALLFMYLSQVNNNERYFLMYFLVVPIVYLMSGVDSLVNRIYGYSANAFSSARYFYDEDNKFGWVAKSQILISIIVSLVITYLIFS